MFSILIWYMDDLRGIIDVYDVNFGLKWIKWGLEFWVLRICIIFKRLEYQDSGISMNRSTN
jgi:hypothetical protein